MKQDEHKSFPLEWPVGWPRARDYRRGPYRISYHRAMDHLIDELELMGATDIVVSSNLPVRKTDGLPYASAARKQIADPGVAVYFRFERDSQVIACDKWEEVRDNLRAIGLTVESLRRIERSGASELMKRAMIGMKSLPAMGESGAAHWSEVLGVDSSATPNEIRAAYRRKSREHHPDNGGDANEFHRVQQALQQALPS